ncbi:MAG: hypothetical protein ACYSTL_05020, partial [Planctomycetota bacterium]
MGKISSKKSLNTALDSHHIYNVLCDLCQGEYRTVVSQVESGLAGETLLVDLPKIFSFLLFGADPKFGFGFIEPFPERNLFDPPVL